MEFLKSGGWRRMFGSISYREEDIVEKEKVGFLADLEINAGSALEEK